MSIMCLGYTRHMVSYISARSSCNGGNDALMITTLKVTDTKKQGIEDTQRPRSFAWVYGQAN